MVGRGRGIAQAIVEADRRSDEKGDGQLGIVA